MALAFSLTALSAALCALGGAVYAQYQMYIGPDTIAGLGLSLNIVFAVIAGGMWTLLGPTVGAVFTQVLAEGLRVAIQGSATLKGLFGNSALALDQIDVHDLERGDGQGDRDAPDAGRDEIAQKGRPARGIKGRMVISRPVRLVA